jgi:hypothetical protein
VTVPPSGDPYAPQPPAPFDQPSPPHPGYGAAPTTTATAEAGTTGDTIPQHPYDTPAPYGAPAWGERPALDGVSVAAFVTGLLTLTLIPLGLGIAGIVRTQGGKRRGRGFAITGVVLGAVSTVIWGLLIAGTMALISSDEFQDSFAAGYSESFNEASGTNLDIGECFEPPADLASGDSLVSVDCAGPHTAETFVVHDITGDDYPGVDGIDAIAQEQCLGAFADYVGMPYEESELDVMYFSPTEITWAVGDRRMVCGIVAYDGSMLEGSVAGSGR